MEMITGTCMFCGQQQTIRVSGKIDENEANLIVTQKCNCDGALKAKTQEETLSRIQQLFGSGCRDMGFEYVCDGHQLRVLREASDAVLLQHIDEAKIKLPNGDMAAFKLTGGVVEITREMKRKKTV